VLEDGNVSINLRSGAIDADGDLVANIVTTRIIITGPQHAAWC
jgi:hypothetical protein